jgi:hypothetical protein
MIMHVLISLFAETPVSAMLRRGAKDHDRGENFKASARLPLRRETL